MGIMKTAVTELLGIRYPIIQGGMMWVGRAELASAVSNAGGLGILTALTQPTPDALRDEIERCRSLTRAPFGVNLTVLPTASPPPYAEYLQAIIDSGVKIVETAGNCPKEYFDKLKAAGIKILHKCTSVRHALSAERNGVDVISIDSFECAGHPGEDDIGGLVLIPAAVKALSIPVIASGGIADGYGLAAALALGAQGVNMGTRFMLTQEAPIHSGIKESVVKGSERDTVLIFRTLKNSGRVFKNAISEQVVAIERQPGGCTFEDIRPLVAGARGRATLESGNVNDGLVWASQSIGLMNDIPTCKELLDRMVRECRVQLAQAAELASA
ncbi:NAD(P)H-dependent flavin oxidoreductase [Pseudomonas fluorescens]|uniref:NAD(P)H-dependent flavin oxidoreductase n=1 Tax=Pseudomonas fluorescens TaxID=294 RepID=UPI001F5E0E75|nr:nitronate monooxygenase [Pseudomonas fluorescens]